MSDNLWVINMIMSQLFFPCFNKYALNCLQIVQQMVTHYTNIPLDRLQNIFAICFTLAHLVAHSDPQTRPCWWSQNMFKNQRRLVLSSCGSKIVQRPAFAALRDRHSWFFQKAAEDTLTTRIVLLLLVSLLHCAEWLLALFTILLTDDPSSVLLVAQFFRFLSPVLKMFWVFDKLLTVGCLVL